MHRDRRRVRNIARRGAVCKGQKRRAQPGNCRMLQESGKELTVRSPLRDSQGSLLRQWMGGSRAARAAVFPGFMLAIRGRWRIAGAAATAAGIGRDGNRYCSKAGQRRHRQQQRQQKSCHNRAVLYAVSSHHVSSLIATSDPVNESRNTKNPQNNPDVSRFGSFI